MNSYLTSAVCRGEWSALRSGCFIHGELASGIHCIGRHQNTNLFPSLKPNTN